MTDANAQVNERPRAGLVETIYRGHRLSAHLDLPLSQTPWLMFSVERLSDGVFLLAAREGVRKTPEVKIAELRGWLNRRLDAMPGDAAGVTLADLGSLEQRMQEALAPLQRDSHEPQAIRPRVLDVLEEFGVITVGQLTPEDVVALGAFRRQRLEEQRAADRTAAQTAMMAAGVIKASELTDG